MHAIWLKNRMSMRSLDNKTPFEMLNGAKPDLSRLQEWGAKVWVHDDSNSKLEGRAHIGKWLGFEEDTDAHRIYWPDTQKVCVERSVCFDDNWVMIPNEVTIEGEPDGFNCNPTNSSMTQNTVAHIPIAPQPIPATSTLQPMTQTPLLDPLGGIVKERQE
jgi:hypothetical protein